MEYLYFSRIAYDLMKLRHKINNLFEHTCDMDDFDLNILTALQNDSRASLTQISDEVGLSRFAVKDRIQRLFEDGVILCLRVVVDPLLVGFKRTVFFEFKTNPHEPWLAKLLDKTSELTCWTESLVSTLFLLGFDLKTMSTLVES